MWSKCAARTTPTGTTKTKTQNGVYVSPFGATHRCLKAIVHAALNGRPYDRVADLAEDVKTAAARQRIPYSGADVSKAIASVGQQRPLIGRRKEP